MINGINLAKGIARQLPQIRQAYHTESMEQLKTNLYEKIQGIIRQQQIKELIDQKTIIANQKATFLEKIFGKEKLKSEQMRWIDLRIMDLTKQPIQYKESYSVKEMLAEIKAFSFTRKTTSVPLLKMQELEANIYQVFSGYTKEEIQEMARVKLEQKPNLPIEVKSKAKFFQIGTEMRMLRMQNDRMDIELKRLPPNQHMRQQMQVKQNSVRIFKSKLQQIENVMKDKDEIQRNKEEVRDEYKSTDRVQ